jgi:hypothetical protein
MRQSITARWSVIPWDLCAVPAKISRKSNWRLMTFIPFAVFSMGVFVNAMVSLFLDWKPLFGFSFALHDSISPLWTQTRCQYFWAKWTDPPSKCVYRLEAGQVSQSSWYRGSISSGHGTVWEELKVIFAIKRFTHYRSPHCDPGPIESVPSSGGKLASIRILEPPPEKPFFPQKPLWLGK